MYEPALSVPPNFTCRRCGNCCRGPGDVLLSAGEDQRIADLLGLDLYEFTSAYTRLTDDHSALSLSERADGACIFLQHDNTCRIQVVKPQQCRAFPYLWQSPRLANMCAGWQVDTQKEMEKEMEKASLVIGHWGEVVGEKTCEITIPPMTNDQ